jgi:hypothetical protein
MNTAQTLIRYIRNKKGQPRGVVVALRDNNEVCYGYSICNPIDRWDRHEGLNRAISRAKEREYDLPTAPNTIKQIVEGYENLSKRAVKYFKDLPREMVEFDSIEMIQ